MLRYQLLPPDIVDRDEFIGFWNPESIPTPTRAAENKAKRRLQFDVDMGVRAAVPHRPHTGAHWQRRRRGVPRVRSKPGASSSAGAQ